jgi:hypothetical protein
MIVLMLLPTRIIYRLLLSVEHCASACNEASSKTSAMCCRPYPWQLGGT